MWHPLAGRLPWGVNGTCSHPLDLTVHPPTRRRPNSLPMGCGSHRKIFGRNSSCHVLKNFKNRSISQLRLGTVHLFNKVKHRLTLRLGVENPLPLCNQYSTPFLLAEYYLIIGSPRPPWPSDPIVKDTYIFGDIFSSKALFTCIVLIVIH